MHKGIMYAKTRGRGRKDVPKHDRGPTIDKNTHFGEVKFVCVLFYPKHYPIEFYPHGDSSRPGVLNLNSSSSWFL